MISPLKETRVVAAFYHLYLKKEANPRVSLRRTIVSVKRMKLGREKLDLN